MCSESWAAFRLTLPGTENHVLRVAPKRLGFRLHDGIDTPRLSNMPVDLTKALALPKHRNVAGMVVSASSAAYPARLRCHGDETRR